jgi:hypothetical protein
MSFLRDDGKGSYFMISADSGKDFLCEQKEVLH